MQFRVGTNRKLISLLCATIIFAAGLVVPTYAADAPTGNPPKVVEAIVIPPVTPFKDVPNDAPYVYAVQYLYEAGISCGTSAETFLPGRAISLAEMATMLCRAYYPAVPMTMAQAAAFLAPGVPQDSQVTWESAISMLSICCDEQIDVAALSHAADALALPGFPSDLAAAMTRSDTAILLHLVNSAELQDRLNISVEADYLETVPHYMSLADQLPMQIQERFQNEGWSTTIGNDRTTAWGLEHGSTIGGLTVYTDKSLFISHRTCFFHEYGHFLFFELGRPEDSFKQLFLEESNNLKEILGDHAMTSCRECFAEFFEHYLDGKKSPEDMAKLKAAAPKTWSYFAGLEANNWGLVETAPETK